MESMASSSRRQVKPEDAAKAKGIAEEMKTEQFLQYLHFMVDYGTILSNCSTDFQNDNRNITRTSQLVTSTTSELLQLTLTLGDGQKTFDDNLTTSEGKALSVEV